MSTALRIDDAWTRLAQGTQFPAQTRVSADHPLDLFAQVDDAQRPGLLALSATKPGTPPSYSSVDIRIGQREDGRWAVSLSLAQSELEPMFASMCNQIVTLGERLAPGTDAGTFLLGQVARWHRLLALGKDGLLSAEERQGLFGELVVLAEAITRFGPGAVHGWVGPDDAPQDLLLPDGLAEVKTIRAGQPTIRISSAEQLDIEDGRLRLAVLEVVEAVPGTGGESLAGQVGLLRGLLLDEPADLQHFEDQLRKAGYSDRQEYSQPELRVTRNRWFAVRPGFPSLARSRMPTGIGAVRYELTLAGLTDFETNPFQTDAGH